MGLPLLRHTVENGEKNVVKTHAPTVYWFRRVAQATTKREGEHLKKVWRNKGYYVRTKCSGKNLVTATPIYEVYVRRKKNAKKK